MELSSLKYSLMPLQIMGIVLYIWEDIKFKDYLALSRGSHIYLSTVVPKELQGRTQGHAHGFLPK
jgi:hypothetical protein